jgi:hypothetical protein
MGFGMGMLAITGQAARRIGELGFIIGAIGGLLFIAGAALRANDAEETRTRNVLMSSGVCITIGFICGIISLHWIR